MTEQELQATFKTYCATRDVAARNLLAQQYLYLARMVARRYAGKGVEYDDLFQISSIALLSALERFDCAKGLRFSTFAVPSMTGVVKNYFRDRSRTLRLPRRVGESVRKVTLAKETLLQKLHRQPTVEELAAEAGLTTAEVLEAFEGAAAAQPTSLDAGVGPDEDMDLSSLLGQEEGAYESIAIRDMIQKVFATLTPTEQEILRQRFYQQRSQRAIAQELGVSQMYISRLERKMLERFREAMEG